MQLPARTRTCVCVYIYICICISTCLCMYIHTYIYIYIYVQSVLCFPGSRFTQPRMALMSSPTPRSPQTRATNRDDNTTALARPKRLRSTHHRSGGGESTNFCGLSQNKNIHISTHTYTYVYIHIFRDAQHNPSQHTKPLKIVGCQNAGPTASSSVYLYG